MKIEIIDFLLAGIYVLMFCVGGFLYQQKMRKLNPVYSYYVKGMLAKFIGGTIFCLIYVYYYGGGDTTIYNNDSISLNNLFFKNINAYYHILIGDIQPIYLSEFDANTGAAGVYVRSYETYFVVRITSLIQFFSFRNFLTTTILLSFISYIAIWKLFKLLCTFYPTIQHRLAQAILFVPSPLFWGSGILKDTYTFAAACWLTYAFYMAFIARKKIATNLFVFILCVVLIINIKPYIFIALVPGLVFWLNQHYITNFKYKILKVLLGPVFAILIGGTAFFLYSSFQDSLGQFSSTDKILNKAVATQQDLKADYYKGNSFDIGDFDNTIGGVASKAPLAIVAGLFRPFLWESKNVVMLLAGLENLVLLVITIMLLIRLGPVRIYNRVKGDPVLFFCFIFSLFFAFSIGLSTSNFGALVRYKIPCIPFYATVLIVLYDMYITEKKQKLERQIKDRKNKMDKPTGINI
ncbi:MAG: hypothetical protein ABL940_06005 [Bacteroidia bacterium]